MVVSFDLFEILLSDELGDLLSKRELLVAFVRIHLALLWSPPVAHALRLGKEVGELLDDLGGHGLGPDVEVFLFGKVHVLGDVGQQLGDERVVD